MTDARVVLVTVSSREEGERIAETIVAERLVACVNIVGPIRSVYRWQEEICRDEEHLLVIKTARSRVRELEERVRGLHSYDVPEVVSLPVDEGSMPYLSWIFEQTRSEGSSDREENS